MRKVRVRLDRVPSLSEYESIVRSLKEKALRQPVLKHVLPLFVAATGCRISECLQVTTADIDWENNSIQIVTLKGGRGAKRVVPVPWWLLAIIQRYIVFNGVGYRLFPISRIQAWRIVKEVTGWHPHALRHAFGMYLLYRGVDVETVKRILGHSSWDMVKYYVEKVRVNIAVVRNPLDEL